MIGRFYRKSWPKSHRSAFYGRVNLLDSGGAPWMAIGRRGQLYRYVVVGCNHSCRYVGSDRAAALGALEVATVVAVLKGAE